MCSPDEPTEDDVREGLKSFHRSLVLVRGDDACDWDIIVSVCVFMYVCWWVGMYVCMYVCMVFVRGEDAYDWDVIVSIFGCVYVCVCTHTCMYLWCLCVGMMQVTGM